MAQIDKALELTLLEKTYDIKIKDGNLKELTKYVLKHCTFEPKIEYIGEDRLPVVTNKKEVMGTIKLCDMILQEFVVRLDNKNEKLFVKMLAKHEKLCDKLASHYTKILTDPKVVKAEFEYRKNRIAENTIRTAKKAIYKIDNHMSNYADPRCCVVDGKTRADYVRMIKDAKTCCPEISTKHYITHIRYNNAVKNTNMLSEYLGNVTVCKDALKVRQNKKSKSSKGNVDPTR